MAEPLHDPWNAAGGPAPAWWALIPGDLQDDMRAAGVAQIAQGFFVVEDELDCRRLAALAVVGLKVAAGVECDCRACEREAAARARAKSAEREAAAAEPRKAVCA